MVVLQLLQAAKLRDQDLAVDQQVKVVSAGDMYIRTGYMCQRSSLLEIGRCSPNAKKKDVWELIEEQDWKLHVTWQDSFSSIPCGTAVLNSARS